MLKLLLALGAGTTLAGAFAPYGFYPLAVVSMAVLFALWRNVTPARGAALGGCYGIGMFGHGVWWVQVSIHQFGLPLYAFSISMTVLFVLMLALFIALAGYTIARFPVRSETLRLLVVMPAVWVAGEWLRGWLFTGFPWLLLGYSQTDSWLAGFAPVFGVHGVSLAVVMLAACLVLVWSERRARAGLAMLVIAGGGWGSAQITWTAPEGESRAVALVQGAVPQAIKWRGEFRAHSLELYEALSAPHWGRDLVLWPETAVPAFPDEIPDTLVRLGKLASRYGTALLVGIPTGDRHTGPYFNSVVLLNTDHQRYDKHHLVPFGEYLPFDRWLRPVLNFLTIPMSSFSPGPSMQMPLRYGALRLGVSICYEDAYASEIIKSLPLANLLVNVSDDAWFGDTIAPHQHLQISRMRALEAGRYLLRATNTGISAIINERGKVIARSPQFESFVLTGHAVARTGATPFVRWGHAPLLLVLALALIVVWRPVRQLAAE